VATRERLWGKNVERFWTHFKLWSDDSLFHWLFKTYWRRKAESPRLLAEPRYAHLVLFRFRTRQEAARWLSSL